MNLSWRLIYLNMNLSQTFEIYSLLLPWLDMSTVNYQISDSLTVGKGRCEQSRTQRSSVYNQRRWSRSSPKNYWNYSSIINIFYLFLYIQKTNARSHLENTSNKIQYLKTELSQGSWPGSEVLPSVVLLILLFFILFWLWFRSVGFRAIGSLRASPLTFSFSVNNWSAFIQSELQEWNPIQGLQRKTLQLWAMDFTDTLCRNWGLKWWEITISEKLRFMTTDISLCLSVFISAQYSISELLYLVYFYCFESCGCFLAWC